MSEPPNADARIAQDAGRLEELARDLTGESSTPNALMREHLEAARFYLLGSMPHEYSLSLGLAQQLLPSIKDEGIQSRISDFLRDQDLSKD